MRAAALVVFLLLIGLYTSEWAIWHHELFRSLPWLTVPLAFTVSVPLTEQQRLTVGALFVVGTAAVGLATLGKYLLDPWGSMKPFALGSTCRLLPTSFTFHLGQC